MEAQRNRKELVWIIIVTIVATVLHHEAAKAIGNVITDTYLQAFIGELFFAILALAIVFVFTVAIYLMDLIFKGLLSLITGGLK